MSDAPDFAPDRRSTVVTEQNIDRRQFGVTQLFGVPDGDKVTLTVTPNPGELLNVTGILVDVVQNGGSGTHEMLVSTDLDTILESIRVEQPGTEDCRFEGVDVPNPSTANTLFPTSAAARAQAVTVLRATNDEPIEVEYLNNTGQQSSAVGIRVGGVARQIA
jgi:hypothetical protein